MSLIFNINGTVIPSSDIKSYPSTDDKIEYSNNSFISDSMKIEIDNTDGSTYSDLYAGSLFYAVDFFRRPVYIYDDEEKRYIWKGRIKNIIQKDSNKTIVIESDTYIQDLANINCVYDNSSTGGSGETPAEIIYSLLTDTDYAAISESDIVYAGFQNAINIQDAASVYVTVQFAEENNKSILSVINELCRMTQCQLYSVDNIIYFYQWQEYDGEIGIEVTDEFLEPNSYSHTYEDKNVYNQYKIAYNNSGTVAWSADSDSSSQSLHGIRPFNVPDEDVDSTSSDDFKILFESSTAAEWAGDLAMARFQYIKKHFDITVDDRLSHVNLNSVARLNWTPFVNEPVRITGRKYDRNKKEIKLSGYFLNTPHEYYSRDVTAPAAVFLASAYPLPNGGVYLKWTQSDESDHLGYKIYFTSTLGEWTSEECLNGKSPVDIKNPSTIEGYAYTVLYGLNPGTRIYFKVVSYDTSYNTSADSNILDAEVALTTFDDVISAYRCTGDPWVSVTLASTNPKSGSVPAVYSKYSDGNKYGSDTYQPASFYVSGYFYDEQGWDTISWKAGGDANDVQFRYRTSSDGSTWGSYSTAIDAVGNKTVEIGGVSYFQYMMIFNSPKWSDSDYFYITDIAPEDT